MIDRMIGLGGRKEDIVDFTYIFALAFIVWFHAWSLTPVIRGSTIADL